MIFGWGLNNGESIPDRLEQMYGNAYDFVNLGFAAGRSPDSYAVWLRSHTEFQNLPILLFIYNNDLYDIETNSCLDAKGLKVGLQDQNCSHIHSDETQIIQGRLYSKDHGVLGYLPLRVLDVLNQTYLFNLAFAAHARLHSAVPREIRAVNSFAYISDLKKKDLLFSVQVLRDLSSQLHIFTLGPRDDVDTPPVYVFLENFCRENSIRYTSIPSFGADFFFPNDGHYNRKGASNAAQITRNTLEGSGFFKHR